MRNQFRRPFIHWLNSDLIAERIDVENLTHARFADHLGLSRSYWSQIYNRKRPLTPMVRCCLLGSRYLQGLSAEDLWERVPSDAPIE
jgi:antitoxin component HigA of HigAB toxin-antitoxin module